jgi:6-phosphogluconolactonase/glucosamine-6-phosphate isomerase/deaminase
MVYLCIRSEYGMNDSRFVKRIFIKTPYVFCASGSSIAYALASKKICFSTKCVVTPCDERLTSVCSQLNRHSLRSLVRRKVRPLSFRDPRLQNNLQQCSVILSVAEDGHFASLWSSSGDLNIARKVQKNIAPTSTCRSRITLGRNSLSHMRKVFLLKSPERLAVLSKMAAKNIYLRILLANSKFLKLY